MLKPDTTATAVSL